MVDRGFNREEHEIDVLNSRRIEIFLRVVMRVLPAFYFSTIRNFVHGNRNRKIMKLDAIIEDMQGLHLLAATADRRVEDDGR